ncbi:MAG: PQQ-binding-like beta-propeller repeat protein [Bryobacteraceae bacterium]
MQYSRLWQITPANVAQLARCWTYHTGEKGRQFETTPVFAGGLLYISSQSARVIALDPETGKEIWKYDPRLTRSKDHRGISYWPGDEKVGPRVLLGTGDGRLIALDARTGVPVHDFGDNGVVNLRTGVADGYPDASYSITSPPAIYENLAIVSPSTQEGPSHGPSGDPRAFDIRTGKLVWRFHSVPQPGEPGNETWGPDGWKERAGPSAWGRMVVDGDRGTVFLPIGNPADSFYGADRKGANLYANSIVALDAQTGKLRWHFQMTHHDIFDYDVTGSPSLVVVDRNGTKIPAVAEITKMGLLFILDRETGRPIFGVEERPVPPSTVPGEQAWPTQPFPLKPPPLSRTSITREELTKRSPEAERYCREQFDKYVVGGLYTPFGMQPTLTFPGAMGGGNWGGVSFDPELDYIFVNTTNMGNIGRMTSTAPGSPMPYRNESAYARFLDHEQYPCQQPPWGELIAISTRSGDIAWKVPLGSYDALEAQGLKNWGTPNVGGLLATAGGVIFIGATNDSRFRAFDSLTGTELWKTKLEATANSTPVSYLGRNGKQYVVVAAGGPDHLRNVGDTSTNSSDTVVAFALSEKELPGSNVTAQRAPAPPPPGRPSPISTEVPATLPEGIEKQALLKVCGKCHGLETFSKARMTREEWQSTVTDMVQRGASGSPEELRTVVDYLSKYLGPRAPVTAGSKP